MVGAYNGQAARHYAIAVDWRSDRNRVVAIRWTAEPVDGSRRRHPGVYCLRTNLVDWDAERLWRTYTMLTDLEAVFRSLKTELGLRPIDSWSTLRDQLVTQQRVTTRFTRKDGKTLHIRHATKAEPAQLRIYSALGIDPSPGGRKKTVA